MDDPTPSVWEILRDVQADVRKILTDQALYVTQEQRASDKALTDLRMANLEEDQKETKARLDRLASGAWTALVAPVIVGVVLYFLLGGKT